MSYDWKNANLESITRNLDNLDWGTEMESLNVEMSWLLLKKTIMENLEKHVPKKKLKNSKGPLWMNQNIMRTIRKKKRLCVAQPSHNLR